MFRIRGSQGIAVFVPHSTLSDDANSRIAAAIGAAFMTPVTWVVNTDLADPQAYHA